ncbi:MAG: cyclic nucleotide-binding domain-containing protein [Spirochaetales bacterium]
MRRLPVLSSDSGINSRIETICSRFSDVFVPTFFGDTDDFLELLRYDLPEVTVVNFSDPLVDAEAILSTLRGDPWLHYGGLIGVVARAEMAAVQQLLTGSNIISLIRRGEFVASFSRVLRILIQNRQILFQRDLQGYLLRSISGSFVMDNDPYNARTYANLITNYLFNLNYIDSEGRDQLHIALFELLMNAIEHGNCAISYEEKNRWLNQGGDILDLVREKRRDPTVRSRRVHFSYRIDKDRSYYTIQDEGPGFDWHARLGDESPSLESHGHGLRMTKAYVDNLAYNDRGNEVAFEFPHSQNEANVVPELFAESNERVFQEGDVVFREGEESDYLYYIVSGRLDIYSSSHKISTLTPDDIFLGEMSFLLNSRRSADVVSSGRSTLVMIDKQRFVSVIKEKPHYGVFLARLIAQRLSRVNHRLAQLEQERLDGTRQ